MFLSNKRSVEIALWITVFTVIPIVLATNEIMEASRSGAEIALWKPFFMEFSSSFVVLLLVPCIVWVDQRIPIASESWAKRLLLHLPLSIVFSSLHILGMYGIRNGVFAFVKEPLLSGDPLWIFVYEYRKDLAVYIIVILAIYTYREIARLRLGEAQLAKPEEGKDDESGILVSKSGLFHFIDPTEIHWVEAAGNYVELHVGSETYMLRSTMKEIESRLGDERFARIHRSTIVKRDEVKKIVPAMNGDRTLVLKSGEEFRFSRRYRQSFERKESCPAS